MRFGSVDFPAVTLFSTAGQAVVPWSLPRLVATRQSTRLAKAIAPHLQLQLHLFRYRTASRSSKVFPIGDPTAVRPEVPKQVSGSGSLRNSPSEADRRFLLKNI